MKYDDASWHSDGDYPADLLPDAGATHIGMFLAWAMLHDLGGELHTKDFPEELAQLRARTITPGQFLLRACDGKFTDEDLSDEGNTFASFYYGVGGQSAEYVPDYEAAFPDLPSTYHVPNTWESYERLAPVIQRRFEQWRAGSNPALDQTPHGGELQE